MSMTRMWTRTLLGACAATLTLATSLGLVACGGKAASYVDGTYVGQSSVWEDADEGNGNGYGVATVTIEGGKIVACTFETFEPDGTRKEGPEYGMVNGKIGNQDYYNKAQKALAANEIYAEHLVNVGNVDGVDVVSGATISYNEFQEAVLNALDQARE